MFRLEMFMLMFCAAVPSFWASSGWASSGQIDFRNDTFNAGFAGDAVYFISRTQAGEEMTVLVSDVPNLCDALKAPQANRDLRVWVAEFTERGDGTLQVKVGSHVILTDDELYDDSFGHKGGVAMLAYIRKQAARPTMSFVGMAARGYLHITDFDKLRGQVKGDYHAMFQLGYNQGMGFMQVASSGRFEASHCPEGTLWQQTLLGQNHV